MKKILLILMALLLAQSSFADWNPNRTYNVLLKKVEEEERRMRREQQKQRDEQRRLDQAVANAQQENYVNQQIAQQLWNEHKPEDYINPNPTQNPGYRAFTNQNDKIQQENRIAVLEERANDNPANLKDPTSEESQAWVSQRWGLIEQNDKGISWKEHADKTWKEFVPKANAALCRNVPNHPKCLGGARKIPTTHTSSPQSQGPQVRYESTRQQHDQAGQKSSRSNKKKDYAPQPQVPRYAQHIPPRPTLAPMGQVDAMFGKPQTKSTTKTRSSGGTKFRSPEKARKADDGQGNTGMANNARRSGNTGKSTAASANNSRGQNRNSRGNVQTTSNNQGNKQTQGNRQTSSINRGTPQNQQQTTKPQTYTSGASANGSKTNKPAPKLTVSFGSSQKNKDAVNTKSAMAAQRKLSTMSLLENNGKHLQVKSISAIKKEIYK